MRQCTDYWKIKPGQRATKFFLHEEQYLKFKITQGDTWYGHGFEGWKFSPFPRGLAVRTWLGYTTDELHRLWRPSQIKWQVPYYPLIELGMTRDDCANYWRGKGLEPPMRSACVFCPNRNDAEWQDMVEKSPVMFEEACRIDDLLRTTDFPAGNPFHKITSPMYVHQSLKPLREVFG